MATNEEIGARGSIDFLPERYREARVKRQASIWRLIVAVMFGALLSSAAMYQQQVLWLAQNDLEQVAPMYAAAQKFAREVADEQAKLPAIQSEAELFTYLRHKWPRTQILSGILTPLPTSTRLTHLQLSLERPEKQVAEASQISGKDDPVDKVPSAARDLKRLRGESDGARWIVSLAGSTTDVSELHEFINAAEDNPLFTKVDLISIEAPSSADSTTIRFAIRISVVPGYGQPGGPTPVTYAKGSVERQSDHVTFSTVRAGGVQ
jgi:hypothetical protein